MRKSIIRCAHKIVISSINETTCKVTIYENMGGRWVRLGPSETWNTQDAIEAYI